MESRGAAAVSKILANESSEIQPMEMVYDGSRDVHHVPAGALPSLAEVAIFGCDSKPGVEAADGSESCSGERHVIRCEEPRVPGIGVIEIVDDILDELLSRGAEFTRETGYGSA